MLGTIFDLDSKKKELIKYENLMSQAGFWGQENSQEIINNVKQLKSIIDPWEKIKANYKHLDELILLLGDEKDEKLEKEVSREIEVLDKFLTKQETKAILGEKEDFYNAYLTINAGAGGTESCDWVSMLYRMYIRWAESKGFACSVVDLLAGEEAGIKNLMILIKGEYAYGLLKSEIGVHRLVRISPFDSNKRRHTSFASVDVLPEILEDINIDINESELKIDTYRSGGSGGQHLNVTDSAVRITHLPTGIVVQCQNERSQHKNKASALKVLKSRLYDLEKKKRDDELNKSYEQKTDIAWGNQIRSYVFHPYQMVKDHRTNYETSDTEGVMDGNIDEFIDAFLKMR